MPNREAEGSVAASELLAHLPSHVVGPGYFPEIGLWLCGNVKLLVSRRGFPERCLGPAQASPALLSWIEVDTGELAFGGRTVVCAVHSEAWQRSAAAALRWGAPRIVVLPGGLRRCLGEKLDREPFEAARLWRFRWDPITDLAVARKAPDGSASRSPSNPAVDRLAARIAASDWAWFVDKALRERRALLRP